MSMRAVTCFAAVLCRLVQHGGGIKFYVSGESLNTVPHILIKVVGQVVS